MPFYNLSNELEISSHRQEYVLDVMCTKGSIWTWWRWNVNSTMTTNLTKFPFFASKASSSNADAFKNSSWWGRASDFDTTKNLPKNWVIVRFRFSQYFRLSRVHVVLCVCVCARNENIQDISIIMYHNLSTSESYCVRYGSTQVARVRSLGVVNESSWFLHETSKEKSEMLRMIYRHNTHISQAKLSELRVLCSSTFEFSYDFNLWFDCARILMNYARKKSFCVKLSSKNQH